MNLSQSIFSSVDQFWNFSFEQACVILWLCLSHLLTLTQRLQLIVVIHLRIQPLVDLHRKNRLENWIWEIKKWRIKIEFIEWGEKVEIIDVNVICNM